MRGLLTATVLGLLVLAALYWMTDGGFVRHIFLYNVNRFALSRLSMLAEGLRDHWPLLLLAVLGLWHGFSHVRTAAGGRLTTLVQVLKGDRAAFTMTVLAVFLALKTVMCCRSSNWDPTSTISSSGCPWS